MAKKPRGVPGSKKGEPKPLKDKIDPGFRDRLWEAMVYRELTSPAKLSKLARCSRQVIGQYLNGGKSAPNALILMRISKALRVSPYWLIQNEGTMLDGIQEEPKSNGSGGSGSAVPFRPQGASKGTPTR